MSKFFSARKEKKRFSKKVLPIKTMTQEKTDCAQAHQIEVSHHEQLPSSTPAGGKTPLEANERKKAHAASRAKTSRTQKSTASKTPRTAKSRAHAKTSGSKQEPSSQAFEAKSDAAGAKRALMALSLGGDQQNSALESAACEPERLPEAGQSKEPSAASSSEAETEVKAESLAAATEEPDKVKVIEPAELQTPQALKQQALLEEYRERMQKRQKAQFEAFLKERQLARIAENPEATKKVFRRTSRGNIKSEVAPRTYASEKERLLALISMPECVDLVQDLAPVDSDDSLWEQFAFARRVSKEDLQKRFVLFLEAVLEAVERGYFEAEFSERLKRLERIEAIEREIAARGTKEGQALGHEDIFAIAEKYGEEALARLEILQKTWARGMPTVDMKLLQESDARVREQRAQKENEKTQDLPDRDSECMSAEMKAPSQEDAVSIAELKQEGLRAMEHARALRRDEMGFIKRTCDRVGEFAEKALRRCRRLFSALREILSNLLNTCTDASKEKSGEKAKCKAAHFGVLRAAWPQALSHACSGRGKKAIAAVVAVMGLAALISAQGGQKLAVVDARAAREVILEIAQSDSLAVSMAAAEGFDALLGAALARTAKEEDCLIMDAQAVLAAPKADALDRTEAVKRLVREAARVLAEQNARVPPEAFALAAQSAVHAVDFPKRPRVVGNAFDAAVLAVADFASWVKEKTIFLGASLWDGAKECALELNEFLELVKAQGRRLMEECLDWLFPRFGVHADSFAARAQRIEEKVSETNQALEARRQEVIKELAQDPAGIRPHEKGEGALDE